MGKLIKVYMETVPDEPNVNGIIYSKDAFHEYIESEKFNDLLLNRKIKFIDGFPRGCSSDKNAIGDVIHVEDDHIIVDITNGDDKVINKLEEYAKKKVCTAYMTYSVNRIEGNCVCSIDKILNFSFAASYRYNPNSGLIKSDASAEVDTANKKCKYIDIKDISVDTGFIYIDLNDCTVKVKFEDIMKLYTDAAMGYLKNEIRESTDNVISEKEKQYEDICNHLKTIPVEDSESDDSANETNSTNSSAGNPALYDEIINSFKMYYSVVISADSRNEIVKFGIDDDDLKCITDAYTGWIIDKMERTDFNVKTIYLTLDGSKNVPSTVELCAATKYSDPENYVTWLKNVYCRSAQKV